MLGTSWNRGAVFKRHFSFLAQDVKKYFQGVKRRSLTGLGCGASS